MQRRPASSPPARGARTPPVAWAGRIRRRRRAARPESNGARFTCAQRAARNLAQRRARRQDAPARAGKAASRRGAHASVSANANKVYTLAAARFQVNRLVRLDACLVVVPRHGPARIKCAILAPCQVQMIPAPSHLESQMKDSAIYYVTSVRDVSFIRQHSERRGQRTRGLIVIYIISSALAGQTVGRPAPLGH